MVELKEKGKLSTTAECKTTPRCSIRESKISCESSVESEYSYHNKYIPETFVDAEADSKNVVKHKHDAMVERNKIGNTTTKLTRKTEDVKEKNLKKHIMSMSSQAKPQIVSVPKKRQKSSEQNITHSKSKPTNKRKAMSYVEETSTASRKRKSSRVSETTSDRTSNSFSRSSRNNSNSDLYFVDTTNDIQNQKACFDVYDKTICETTEKDVRLLRTGLNLDKLLSRGTPFSSLSTGATTTAASRSSTPDDYNKGRGTGSSVHSRRCKQCSLIEVKNKEALLQCESMHCKEFYHRHCVKLAVQELVRKHKDVKSYEISCPACFAKERRIQGMIDESSGTKHMYNNASVTVQLKRLPDDSQRRTLQDILEGVCSDMTFEMQWTKMAARSGATQTVVSGTERFKYFKRPVMPRVSAIAPQVLLAPTTMDDPLVAVNTYVEPSMKDVEIQTMYRDSEAQTTPYTPAYVTNDGENPEILLLKKLTYENGLPLGKKEIDMLEYARAKREMEMNLPPFTDEASLSLRKKLMEQQEMREFRLRETEIDRKREEKLEELQMTMMEREESNEFMVSQRLEGVRLLRMEEKEKILQKIRNKRVKALRRIAHQRNVSDPVLSDGTSRDIINDYFDRGSTVYAPVPREGKENDVQTSRYDVASRTVPLHNIGNILSLEYTIPRRYLDADGHEDKNNMAPTHLSKTAPVGSAVNMRNNGGGGRASEDRLTSAAARTIRNTKRDIEEMHSILSQRKHTFPAAAMLHLNNNNTQPLSPGTAGGTQHSRDFNDTRKFKGRPTTPDFTANRSTTTNQQTITFENDEDASEFQRAIILLQRLLRGRAVQNIMFEGKYRRTELINELKMADDAKMLHHEADVNKIDLELKIERETAIRESTLNTVAGSLASSILTTLAQEKNRVELITSLEQFAVNAVLERRMREEAEAGRRQKEGLGKK